jgi:hypothetical protein
MDRMTSMNKFKDIVEVEKRIMNFKLRIMNFSLKFIMSVKSVMSFDR